MELDETSGSDRPHILVVDDELMIREMLREAIEEAGYECSTAGSGEEALEILDRRNADVVITDIVMPGLNGIELLSMIRETSSSEVIVITGHMDDFSFEQIIDQGASDFMNKPFNFRELVIRLQRILRQRELIAERNEAYENLEATNQQLMKYGKDLNETFLDLKAAHQELLESYLDTIHRLVLAAEYKDEDTGDHIVRIGRYSAFLSQKLGFSDREVQNILYAAPMHDVGKIGIPDSILMKPGKLTAEEFETMKAHTTIGAKLLADSRSEILQSAEKIALTHHEKWNGEGYPQGISGRKIPILGRIVSIADVFDALTSKRPYKEPYPVKEAIDIIEKERGKYFDPQVVDVFLEHIDEMLKIKEEVNATKHKSIMPGF
jgi:putative two-component system response regulator